MHNGIGATYCRTNGLSTTVKEAFAYTQTVSRGYGKKRLGDDGVKLPRPFEAKALPFPTEGTSAGVQIQSRRHRSAETPIRATMGSEHRPSGSGDRGKFTPSFLSESEFPPLGGSSAKAIRNSLGKGKGRRSAEEVHAHVPPKPQQLTQGVPGFTGQAERQRDLIQNKQSVDNDGSEAGDQQGAEIGKGLETGDRRSGWENDRGHTSVPSNPQQLTQGVPGFAGQMERQRDLIQSRQSVDNDGSEPGDQQGAEIGKGLETGDRRGGWENDRGHTSVPSKPQQLTQRVSGSGEGTARQRNLNQNRRSVSHDGREANYREGAEVGKGLETGNRRNGWQNDHGHTYAPSKPRQSTQRVSGSGEGTVRQRNLNQNRQSVSHDGREANYREGAEVGKGLETGIRRNGWQNDHGHTYVPSKPRQLTQRVSGSGEATERHRNSDQDRQSVDHDRREAGDRQYAAWENIDALGRTMSRILRHQAAELNLKMSSDGYVNVQDLLKLSMKTRSHRPLSSYSIDEVKQAVQQDDKQRFGIKEGNGQFSIRANQGHTLAVVKADDLLKPIVSADEAPICVHGTYRKFLDQIFEEGLKCMGRNHVHFATGVLGSDGVISGMRTSAQVLIHLNVDKALADGMKLYISENKVILTEGFEGVVPPEYFKEVLSLPDMRRLAPRSRPA